MKLLEAEQAVLGGILQAPGPVGPNVDFMHWSDDAGIQNFLDRPSRRGGVALVSHLG